MRIKWPGQLLADLDENKNKFVQKLNSIPFAKSMPIYCVRKYKKKPSAGLLCYDNTLSKFIIAWHADYKDMMSFREFLACRILLFFHSS